MSTPTRGWSAFGGNYTFTNQEYDSESELYYYNARYYPPSLRYGRAGNPAIGRFISRDPVSGRVGNSVSRNGYVYVLNNPLKYTDPSGEEENSFDNNTGEIKQDIKNTSVLLRIINQKYGTKYTIKDILYLNGLQTDSQLIKGVKLIPNDRTPDVTCELTSKMQDYAKEARFRGPWFFKGKVKPNGSWDLKNLPGTFDIKTHDSFVLFGSVIRKDAPGNISYGFIGKATLWAWETLLLKEAGKVQANSQPEWQNEPYYGDDPVDQYYIKYGFSLYDQFGINIYSNTIGKRIIQQIPSVAVLEKVFYAN